MLIHSLSRSGESRVSNQEEDIFVYNLRKGFQLANLMEVGYRTKKLAKQAQSLKTLTHAFGAVGGKRFLQRLAEFAAADCLEDLRNLPGPRCHELTGDRKGQFAVDLHHPYRLIFIPADDPPPRNEDGGWDWNAITILEILEVTNYHD